jgi:hypothetical protein
MQIPRLGFHSPSLGDCEGWSTSLGMTTHGVFYKAIPKLKTVIQNKNFLKITARMPEIIITVLPAKE